MKTNIVALSFLVTIIAVLGCNNTSESVVGLQQEETNETPQVLENNDDYKSLSTSKRYDSDIVSKLYKEAIEKSSILEQLTDDIDNMGQLKKDSLEDYANFSRINKNYWITVNKYINQLQDSVLKESTLEIFETLEDKYKIKMSGHEEKLIAIREKTLTLNDQLILMKLFITEPMVKNYQMNEFPDIKTLESVINKYDELIEETGEYTKILK
jgi:hypothetical protein